MHVIDTLNKRLVEDATQNELRQCYRKTVNQSNIITSRSLAGNSQRFSFLTVSLYGKRERERERERESSFLTVSLYDKREREREIVRRSPRCNFLTVSLYDIMIQ